ncbi:MAG TPA: hypothetical protein PK605_03450 [Ignavibacteria bacterium]|mgnify:FL=1|nr:hypothetical protein [Bacteroidota bacterium]HRE12234.1 hypothetical protein [Ignavibacteria bacterium]HRF65012.1 hypothetical protein [Ignavibacteria bacterium]HRJ03439.1 hypothetical protein [Ignavibacteria bacterium]HRJ85316.1 hypothetical protein [Ignavibacteria bacterium]
MLKRLILPLFLIAAVTVISFQLQGCSTDEIINAVTKNEVTAKDRLDSANAQATRTYGPNTKLVLIMGKNVLANGKTEISLINSISDPSSIGAWLYVYRVPADTSLRIYTPNPLPTANDCIELTALFNTNQLLSLIQDTSARGLISGALDLIISTDLSISTTPSALINSDASMSLSFSTSPVIKFNDNFIPASSTMNGSKFFQTGTNQTRNMILIPAAGTLGLPAFITELSGFPLDLWIVQYNKTNTSNQSESLILGTVVSSGQVMGIPSLGLSSTVINLSKYVNE